jgi:hypothetical protein
MVLQPGNVWVIEKALKRDENAEAALMTCYMRGRAEPIEPSIPAGDLTADPTLPPDLAFTKNEVIFRLTEGGWSALNRAHTWTVAGILLAALSLVVTVAVAS